MSASKLSFPGYSAIAAASAAVVMLLTWAWVITMPLAFLDPEYAAWLAKEELLARCDLGAMIVLGDSRAAADVLPAAMPYVTTNLAVGGGEPVEALAAARRALSCPHPPRRVLLSFNPGQFMHPDLFWERTVRFGFVSNREVAELGRESRAAGDPSVYENGHGDGLVGPVRALLYAVRFPSLYFSSLEKGGVFLRLFQNRRALHDHLAARGQYYFGVAAGCSDVAAEGHLTDFRPLPVLDRYFDHLLALLAAAGVEVDFIAMPVNEDTRAAMRPELREGFAAYLHRYEVRYPNFRVRGAVLRGWPDRLFGDAFSHLNPSGAKLFSAIVATCIRTQGVACALDWSANAAQGGASEQSEKAAWSRPRNTRFPVSITAASAISLSRP